MAWLSGFPPAREGLACGRSGSGGLPRAGWLGVAGAKRPCEKAFEAQKLWPMRHMLQCTARHDGLRGVRSLANRCTCRVGLPFSVDCRKRGGYPGSGDPSGLAEDTVTAYKMIPVNRLYRRMSGDLNIPLALAEKLSMSSRIK